MVRSFDWQCLCISSKLSCVPVPSVNSIPPACSLAGAVELVPHLPARLGLWRHPHPHAGHQDGRSLQARLRPAQRLAGPATARLVHDGHAAETGLLPDAVRQAGEAGGRQAVLRLHPPVDHVAGRAGGAGLEHFPREEGSVRARGVQWCSGHFFFFLSLLDRMIQPYSRKKQTWRLSKEKTKTIICDLYLKNKTWGKKRLIGWLVVWRQRLMNSKSCHETVCDRNYCERWTLHWKLNEGSPSPSQVFKLFGNVFSFRCLLFRSYNWCSLSNLHSTLTPSVL